MRYYGVSAAFDEVGSDHCGNWEEDAVLDFNLDLNILPSSSQELANATLNEDEETEVNVMHDLDGEEVTYEE